MVELAMAEVGVETQVASVQLAKLHEVFIARTWLLTLTVHVTCTNRSAIKLI